MNLLITHFHGLTKELDALLCGFADKISSNNQNERTYWKMSNATLDDFAKHYPKNFQVYRISEDSKDDDFGCDFLIMVSNKNNFHTC